MKVKQKKNDSSLDQLGDKIRLPAEWEAHDGVWLAWPTEADLWRHHLTGVQGEFATLCEAISRNGGEAVEVLVRSAADRDIASRALMNTKVNYHVVPHDDIWLRDTGPLFAERGSELICLGLIFNGWGKKYPYLLDQTVSKSIAAIRQLPFLPVSIVLEGGGIEHNGAGTMLTTKQCVLNENRNPGMTVDKANDIFLQHLGMKQVIWIERGLEHDHTDGHIDNLVRFVNESTVVCMKPEQKSDPNYHILENIIKVLEKATDQNGKSLTIEVLPSVGLLTGDAGQVLPASYMNFYIGNKNIVLPVYGKENDTRAADTLSRLFQGRELIALSSMKLLHGGGSFHCITQQMPRAPRKINN